MMLYYRGDTSETAAGLNVQFWVLVTGGDWSRATAFLEQPSPRKFEVLLNDLKPTGASGFCTSRRAARWGNARHRPKHAATRLPPVGPPEAHSEFFAAGANGTNMRQWVSDRRKATANDSSSQ